MRCMCVFLCVLVRVFVHDTVTSMHTSGIKPAVAGRIYSSYQSTCACVVIDAKVELVLYSSGLSECTETRHARQERNNARNMRRLRQRERETLRDWLEKGGRIQVDAVLNCNRARAGRPS